MQLSDEHRLGAMGGLLLALAFPIGFGVFEVASQKKPSLLTYLGLINVMLTGGLGIMRLEGFWFAVKEATFPLIIGLITLHSIRWRQNLAERILMTDMLWNMDKIHQTLEMGTNNKKKDFQKLLHKTTLIIAASFFLSACLNFTLAYVLLKSPAGTPEFNQELASMQLLSYPIIVLPCLVLLSISILMLLSSLPKITGLRLEELLTQQKPNS